MKKIAVAFILGLSLALAGCSSKPDVSDVKDEIIGFFQNSCPIVEASNFKKLNGLDNGRSYRMAFSYDITFVRGHEDLEQYCSTMGMYALATINPRFMYSFNKGDVYTITKEVDMVKSENGWIRQ